MARPTPFEFVLAPIAEERFPTIRSALAAAGRDPTDRDAFLMEREAVVLLRELRPEEGLGERMDQLAALVHQAYLFWDAGQVTVDVLADQLPGLLGAGATSAGRGAFRLPITLGFPNAASGRRFWKANRPSRWTASSCPRHRRGRAQGPRHLRAAPGADGIQRRRGGRAAARRPRP